MSLSITDLHTSTCLITRNVIKIRLLKILQVNYSFLSFLLFQEILLMEASSNSGWCKDRYSHEVKAFQTGIVLLSNFPKSVCTLLLDSHSANENHLLILVGLNPLY